MVSRDALWYSAFSEDGYCTAGTMVESLKYVDSRDLSKAREAAKRMSQWALPDNQTASTADIGPGAGSIESAVHLALAQVVKSAHRPQQEQSAGSATMHTLSARRGGRHIRQRGGRQGSSSKAAEKGLSPDVSSHDPSGVQDAIEVLQAEERQLHAAIALFGFDGLHAAAPMIADLCILQEHRHVLQLISSTQSPSAYHGRLEGFLTSPEHVCGSLSIALVDHVSGPRPPGLSHAHAGARIADIRPGLCLKRLFRAAAGQGQAILPQQLLLVSAEDAASSGNSKLAQQLLHEAAALASSIEAPHRPAPAGSAIDSDSQLKAALLQLKLGALNAQAHSSVTFAEPLRLLHTGGLRAYHVRSVAAMP